MKLFLTATFCFVVASVLANEDRVDVGLNNKNNAAAKPAGRLLSVSPTCVDNVTTLYEKNPEFGAWVNHTFATVDQNGRVDLDTRQALGQDRFDDVVQICQDLSGHTAETISLYFECNGTAPFTISNIIRCVPPSCSDADLAELNQMTEASFEDSLTECSAALTAFKLSGDDDDDDDDDTNTSAALAWGGPHVVLKLVAAALLTIAVVFGM